MTSTFATVLLTLFLVVIPAKTFADVDANSIFLEARSPASNLDLILHSISSTMSEMYVKSPGKYAESRYPLVTQTGTAIWLKYINNKIVANANITKIEGFIKLTREQRKKLVSEVLLLIMMHTKANVNLVSQTGMLMGLKSHHVFLCLKINDLRYDDKNESISGVLPGKLSLGPYYLSGLAAYSDGEFVFSESYYLNLKVNGGIAVSGDPKKFVIERE